MCSHNGSYASVRDAEYDADLSPVSESQGENEAMIKEIVKLFTEFFAFLAGRKSKAPDREKEFLKAAIKLTPTNKALLIFMERSGACGYIEIVKRFPTVPGLSERVKLLEAKGFIERGGNDLWKISDAYLPHIPIRNDETRM